MTPAIRHYPSCSAKYPEKPAGEKPQKIVKIDLEEDGEIVHQCVDCGAFVIEVEK